MTMHSDDMNSVDERTMHEAINDSRNAIEEAELDGRLKPNLPALRKLDEWVQHEASRHAEVRDWKQVEWRCATGMCCAGYATEALSDYDWLFHADDDRSHIAVKRSADGTPDLTTARTAATVAQEVLGLGVDQSSKLFAGSNSAADIHHIIGRIFRDEGDSLD